MTQFGSGLSRNLEPVTTMSDRPDLSLMDDATVSMVYGDIGSKRTKEKVEKYRRCLRNQQNSASVALVNKYSIARAMRSIPRYIIEWSYINDAKGLSEVIKMRERMKASNGVESYYNSQVVTFF